MQYDADAVASPSSDARNSFDAGVYIERGEADYSGHANSARASLSRRLTNRL